MSCIGAQFDRETRFPPEGAGRSAELRSRFADRSEIPVPRVDGECRAAPTGFRTRAGGTSEAPRCVAAVGHGPGTGRHKSREYDRKC